MSRWPNRTVSERFWEKVDKSGDCWTWTAYTNRTGYGEFRTGGSAKLSHRVAYELMYGDIPASLVIDHMCHNPPCVRPSHLQAITQAENMQNMTSDRTGTTYGIRGVSVCNQTGRHRVQVGGRHIGRYDTLEEAETAAIAARNEIYTNNLVDRGITVPELLTQRDILDALERAIAPLDDSASMLTMNDDLLELLVEELVPEDDKVRRLGVDHFILLLDICTPDAYELAMLISDCHQAGHAWSGTYEQLAARYDASLVAA